MVRRYNTANQYNIVGFCDEFQEFIRIVRYLPENRLVCVIRLFDSGFWNHPDDIHDKSRYVILPPESEQNPPFAEVSYEEAAAAGWDRYLRIFRTDYDFNETSIHAAQEDDEKLTLTMWGGFIDGRRLYTNAIPRTNRFFLHIHKPFTVHRGPFNEADLTGRFPETPRVLLGFSLGSFLVREYLNRYSDPLAGAVIAGTGHQPGFVLSVMAAIVKTQVKKAGFDRTTPLVETLSFGTYNKKFAPNRTPSDWLCSDDAQLDAYRADALCRPSISSGLFLQLLESMNRTGRPEIYANVNRDLPVLLLSGEDDPVGDGGNGVRRVEQAMRGAGMKNVTVKLFPGARHDIFHEEKSGTAEEVRTLLGDWILAETAKK